MGNITFDGTGFMTRHNEHRVEFQKPGKYLITVVGSSFPGYATHSLCFEYKEGSGEPRPEPACYENPQGRYSTIVRATNLLTVWKHPAEADLVECYYTDASRKVAHLRWRTVANDLQMDLIVEVEELLT